MALDRVRNDVYARALERVITPDSVVLDLGAGLGIHGLMAARLGARRVYLVEPEDVIAVAGEAARANGLQDVVRCLQGRLEDVQIPEPVDVIVSVLTGNLLLSEDLLPVLFRARDQYLKPGGALIPAAATIELAPVTAPGLFEREIAGWAIPQHDVMLSVARTYAANTVHFRWDRSEVTALAASRTIHTLDFAAASYDALHAEATFPVQTAGLCHGLAGWFTMQLGDEWVSTGPDAAPMHWSAGFFPLDPPLPLTIGDTLTVRLDRPPFGDWSWRVSSAAGSRRQSTMLSMPLTPATLEKAATTHRPSLSADGDAAQYVLSQCTGSSTVADIAANVRSRWPDRHRTVEDALRFVQRLVKSLS